ncbi:hypothetical protein JR316_0006637 [Psilocybe cubensis]|uniref:Uncharacterized protein n=1 Tax=Psilocybe cubensis TaxID=181762 RepID=A0ACB8GWB9_PSICU|nr:hypothetical protein JR316_0006637 [Psilocybe cubensis]KAH9480040.1 hypothetical protein JR316_0006637 [Psilocybe cubensis]
MSSSAREVFTVTSLVEISFNKFIGYLQNIYNKREESHSFYAIADYWAKRNAAGKASIKQFYTSRMTHAFEHGTVPMDQFGNFDRNIVTKVMVEAMRQEVSSVDSPNAS